MDTMKLVKHDTEFPFSPLVNKGSSKIKLIECPRDAMQGWKTFIPTEKKIEYINQLLQVGFDTIDFGSFVSAKTIPQMADTKEVITQLSTKNSNTKLLSIIANVRGALDAAEFENILPRISFFYFCYFSNAQYQQHH